jgi:hypothetical protein
MASPPFYLLFFFSSLSRLASGARMVCPDVSLAPIFASVLAKGKGDVSGR